MTKQLLTAAAAALVAFAPLGCNESSKGGVVGSAGSTTGVTGSSKSTFKVTAPTLATNIKQGDRETVKVSLDRGSEFKQAVKLDVTGPSALTAKFANATVAASDPADVNLTIEVAKDAPVGEHVLKVTATPETGTATMVDVKVKVEAK